MKDFVWTPNNVSSTRAANAMIRTQIESAELQKYLDALPVRRIADVGSGFGRLSHACALKGRQVDGFERESSMVYVARKLVPHACFEVAENLWDLPVDSSAYDLALSFTVLQHMSDGEAGAVMAEMKRIAHWVLIVEDTDPRRAVAYTDGHYSNGRPVWWYREKMQPFELRAISLREVEPGFKRGKRTWRGIGHFMLFEAPRVEEIITLDEVQQ